MQQGGLHNFPELLNLLFTSTNITVGDIRLLLDLWYDNTFEFSFNGNMAKNEHKDDAMMTTSDIPESCSYD